MESCSSDEEKEFSLISVNYDACEKIFNSFIKKRNYVGMSIHGRIMDEESGNEKDEEGSVKNKKLVSFEQAIISRSPNKKEEKDDDDDNDDKNKNKNIKKFKNDDHIKISMIEKRKSDVLLRKKISNIYNDSKYNNFMDAFKQQELQKIKGFHYFYKWNVAASILFILVIIFILIGLFIYYESSQVIEVNIAYESGDTNKIFQITEEMKQPVYIYYKISNFYVNFKNFLSDESHSLVNDCKCKYIKTFEDIYKFRCVDSIQTLPELNDNLGINEKQKNISRNNQICDINSVNDYEKKKIIYPCGLVSASIFNDKINLSANTEQFNIDKFPVVNYYDFFSYVKKHKKFSSKYKIWLNTFSPDYKNWFSPPMTSSFIKPYGVINENLKPGDNYKITFTQNTWPDKYWKASKSFQLVSLRAVGNGTYELAYAFFLLALIYFIVIIIMLILVKCGYRKLGKTLSYCKISINKNIEKTFSRMKSNMQNVRRMKSGHMPMGKQGSKNSSFDSAAIAANIVQKMCLCPLH
ncbi:LEM3/CDC50 family protein [Plasmodium brasilianum]|uniref:LEM3/CDC50 family protein, putative n=2 Tax=Plasmodium (Plasmodium) TaxID=418103 RepID=A0A1A8VUI5_PLAMA|nr:LEM3/CDC50 family protein, putative [Plasmodium malariae]KAI4837935.1 LEM3/CDC50 family protein [Plasmodium brasilianum]SBS83342.1 conserved Plasmodium protein, unknown function [Plasmodium malariae]SCN45109.1 LEM3/CDC50 family protein, putative [Plasmodium malariae]